jgi:ABC-2 type transport system ATP-binding protein
MLEAVGLTKRYEDGVLALDHISFAVRRGEILTMLGGNGAGKTTTINLFLNFIEPTEGEARIDGIVTHTDPLRAKEKVSFVSENVMLYPNFTTSDGPSCGSVWPRTRTTNACAGSPRGCGRSAASPSRF